MKTNATDRERLNTIPTEEYDEADYWEAYDNALVHSGEWREGK